MSASPLAAVGDDAQTPTRALALGDARWRGFALGVAVAFAIVWTLSLGKAFHWDAVNYHFYLGYAALNDRFAVDFFAAGTPSYINPYAYVPLHVLSDAEVPAVVVAVLFASVHALILWLAYELALVLAAAGSTRERQGFAMLAMVLAALSPVLLQGLGLTLVDIPIGALVVAAWVLLAIAIRDRRLAFVALAGALGGAAAALKLSNALYAAAALSMVPFFPGTLAQKTKAAIVYCAACGLAFVAVSAPWSWKLWQAFDNPVFPFLNEIFKSPDFTSVKLHYERFRPATLGEYLLRPFDMLAASSRLHTEGRAPDLRFLALFGAILGGGAIAIWKSRDARGSLIARVLQGGVEQRIMVALCVGFLVAWCLWLKASGNSRYFIPMACVAAALLATLLQRAYRKWKDGTLVVIALLLIAQTVQISMGSDWKRDGLAWEGPLLRAQFPQRFRDEPHLFLSTSFLSGSAFLPRWHPQSGMMTISGFYAIGPGRPGWERATALIQRNSDRLRILSILPRGYDETTPLPGKPSDLDVYVRRFGLRVDASDCEIVKLQGNLDEEGKNDDRLRWTSWLTCKLRPAPEEAERYLREVADVDVIFDRVEAVCPNLFHPPRPVTEQLPRWTRVYNMGSEIQLWIESGRVLYFSALIGGDAIDIGSVAAWSQGAQPIDCSKRSAPAFGGMLK